MVTSGIEHPFDVLATIEESYEVDTKISPKTTKRQLRRIKEEFKEKAERWGLLWTRSTKAYEIKDTELVSYETQFRKTRRRLAIKLLSTEFRQKYEDELDDAKTSSEVFSLMEDIIGKVSDSEERKDAKDRLRDISRRTEEEESFTRFCARIEKLAKIASGGEKILSDYFVKESFFANLSPELKRYLLDQDKENQSPMETAKFLDSKKKNLRKAGIRAISAAELQLQEQVAALTAQLAAVPDIIRETLGQSVNSAVSDQMHAIRNEIGEIKKISSKAASNTWKEERRQEQAQHVQTAANFMGQQQPQRARDDSRRKERCRRCGFTNHKTEDCRGTSTKRCFVCDQTGHMSFVCPLKMPKN